jgi:hypothetical protein
MDARVGNRDRIETERVAVVKQIHQFHQFRAASTYVHSNKSGA